MQARSPPPRVGTNEGYVAPGLNFGECPELGDEVANHPIGARCETLIGILRRGWLTR
jgi:hypothetical protein